MNFENESLTSKCEGINLREMNKLLLDIKNSKVELFDKNTGKVIFSIDNNSNGKYVFAPRTRVTFQEALDAYANYKQIQCLILNEEGLVEEVETYYRGEGLEIALDFNEMLNGHWFILD